MLNRTKFSPALILIFLVPLLSNCSDKKYVNMEADARKIAGMQCASRQFTREKFLLANRYTRLDNQLINKEIDKDQADSSRKILDVRKKKLLKEAQQESDSLLHFLRGLWKDDYSTIEDRNVLDSLTEIELTKICRGDSV